MQLELLPSPVTQLLLAETFPGREHGFARGAGTSQSCSDTPGVGQAWLQGKELNMSGLGMMFSIAFG